MLRGEKATSRNDYHSVGGFWNGPMMTSEDSSMVGQRSLFHGCDSVLGPRPQVCFRSLKFRTIPRDTDAYTRSVELGLPDTELVPAYFLIAKIRKKIGTRFAATPSAP